MQRDRTPRWSAVVAPALAALTAGGCGAKTGLGVPDQEYPFDAPDFLDGTVEIPRAARCLPTRVRTQIGFVTSLRPDLDVPAAGGYQWRLQRRPDGSRATLFEDGSEIATLTPDRVGEYEAEVTLAGAGADGGVLRCTVTLVAEPPDPMCPGYALAEPRVIAVPGGSTQVGYDIAWGLPRTTGDASVGAVLSDDVSARVAAVVIERPARTSGSADEMLAEAGTRNESELLRALGAEALLLGRTSRTADGLPLRRSTLRIPMGPVTSPGALRDAALQALTGLAPVDEPRTVHAPASAFYVEVATLVRLDPAREITVVAISPVAAFDDPALPTAIRVGDLTNGTALTSAGRSFEVRCHAVASTRTLMADFLWLVDTSGSMSDDQERVGRAAERFFYEMNSAGLDFRVGVFQAGSRRVNLLRGGGPDGDSPFRWISGTERDGARAMAWQVTEEPYPGLPPEPPARAGNLRPFRLAGEEEEPVAAAILVTEEFERRERDGERNPEFMFRTGAARVAFFVTDEPGGNDYFRFFSRNTARWGSDSDPSQLIQNIASFFVDHNVVPFGMVWTDNGGSSVCPSIPGLPACVTIAGGGAYIPIEIANSREADSLFASAMARVVDAVAGAASEFILPVAPLSSTLRVRIDGRLAPRSRAAGFDYEDRSRALVFRGASFHPRRGQEVRTAYFLWTDR
jgi:hypothetical protein